VIEDKFKKLMVECPSVVRDVVLTNQQIEVVKLVARIQDRKDGVLSPDIAGAMGWLVPHASALLRQLVRKGYLTRVQRNSATGGCEYVYRTITALEGVK